MTTARRMLKSRAFKRISVGSSAFNVCRFIVPQERQIPLCCEK
jgi:hypothetical protein